MADWKWVNTPDAEWVDVGTDSKWVDHEVSLTVTPILSYNGIHSLIFGGQIITG